MKAEIQQLEGALAEVAAIRQRLDGVSDQIRTTIGLLQVNARIADLRSEAASECERKEAAEAAQERQRRDRQEKAALTILQGIVKAVAAAYEPGQDTEQPDPKKAEQSQQKPDDKESRT
jgi:hypothetical protein